MIEIQDRPKARDLCRDIVALHRLNKARKASPEPQEAHSDDFAHISDTNGSPRESLNTEHLRRVILARDIWEAKCCKAQFIGRILQSDAPVEARGEC